MTVKTPSDAIAIIGMACRVPGADHVDAFWENIKNGVESVSEFSDAELAASGVPPSLLNDPSYVKKGFVIDRPALFDAAFFGYSPREAETMDPQHRLFLEIAWRTFENAGYAPETFPGEIGIFAGAKLSTYLINQLSRQPLAGSLVGFQTLIGNDKDYLTSRVSYKLNLRGPSISVQTACSTSLVAVHMACESLLSGACDMVLAGGAAIMVPQKAGYLFQKGMILSPDGRCRPFDARAKGMAGGNGVGAVLLKPLEAAIADRDRIHAVILGSAVNNDGAGKAGYTAPGMAGQTAVIREALKISRVSPDTIDYIEAHGTGTEIGDPMEISALTRVFREQTGRKGFCAIGSVKANIGHLDTVAGVASLIKTVMALKHHTFPPNPNFEKPNPRIQFSDTPFFVNSEQKEWKLNGHPRRAGISSFGFGGTNAHIIVEEAPYLPRETQNHLPCYVFTLSAKDTRALDNLSGQMVTFLEKPLAPPVEDLCLTANTGRTAFGKRLATVVPSTEALHRTLAERNLRQRPFKLWETAFTTNKTVFLFTGQGTQKPGMGKELYETNDAFHSILDRCDEIMRPELELPLVSLMFGQHPESKRLNETAFAQPAIFALGCALAEMWQVWNIRPDAVMGHSVGEYVAACVAGVFSLEDGLKLMAARGRLMQRIEGGGMTALIANEVTVRTAIAPYADRINVAALNGPENTVISGPKDQVNAVAAAMAEEGVQSISLNVSHAFHSPMMTEMIEPFRSVLNEVRFSKPRIPLISNLTGRAAGENDMNCPDYWCRHVVEPVRFIDGLATLRADGFSRFLEIGPSPVLTGMGKSNAVDRREIWIPTLNRKTSEWQSVLEGVAQLYVSGADIDWQKFCAYNPGRRTTMPGYPLRRKRFWAEASAHGASIKDPGRTRWPALCRAGTEQARDTGRFIDARLIKSISLQERLCREFVRTAFLELSLFPADKGLMELSSAAEDAGVIPKFYPMVRRLSDTLVKAGCLINSGTLYGELPPANRPVAEIFLPGISDIFPHNPVLAELVADCGKHLAAVLRGQKDHREIVFPGGSFHRVESLYIDTPNSSYFNAIIGAIAEQLGASPSRNTPLRVLEIGAGTGATTEAVLPHLPSSHTEYLFTDISPFFLGKAEKRFAADYPFVSYQRMDICESPESQGISALNFDVIIAANILHATPHLGETMINVSSLLVPGGTLVIREITRPQLLFEIIFGPLLTLLQDDHLRHGIPFLTVDGWARLAKNYGLRDLTEFPVPGTAADILGEHVMIAKKPIENAAGRIHAVPSPDDAERSALGLTTTDLKDQPVPSQGKHKARTDEVYYVVQWQPLPISARNSNVHASPGLWALWADRGGIHKDVAETLTRHGHRTILTGPGKSGGQRIRKAIAAGDVPFRGLLYLGSLDSGFSPDMDSEALGQELLGCFTGLIEALKMISSVDGEKPLLCIATQGVNAMETETATSPDITRAPLWALARTLVFEHPEIRTVTVDLDSSQTSNNLYAQDLLLALDRAAEEPGLAIRNGTLLVPRLIRKKYGSETFSRAIGEGTHLITGGMGGAGLAMAHRLVKQGARHLALIGRNRPAEETENQLDRLRESGARVEVITADVEDESELQAALARIRKRMPQLTYVYHLAGILEASPLLQLMPAEIARIMAAKCLGAWNLHRLTRDDDLDRFVMFSSVAALWSGHGLGAYAAANGFMDTLAHLRHSQGLPALSINWGAFSDVGMISGDAAGTARRDEAGILAFKIWDALDRLDRAAATGVPHLSIADIQWPSFLNSLPQEARPFFSVMAEEISYRPPTPEHSPTGNACTTFLQDLQRVPEARRRDMLLPYLKIRIAEALRLDKDKITPEGDLLELGMDSLIFIDLSQTLSRDLRVKLTSRKLFEYPRLSALALILAREIGPSGKNSGHWVDIAKSFDLSENPGERYEPFAMTDIQQAYWVGKNGLMGMARTACHTYYEIEIDTLDPARYGYAWERLIRRHDMLRAVVVEDGSQKVLEEVPPLEISLMDLTRTDPATADEKLSAIRLEMDHRIIDTRSWPPFDLRITKLASQSFRLHIGMDLQFADAHSLRLMLRELITFYWEDSVQPEILTHRFRDYIKGTETFRRSRWYLNSRDYWLGRLSTLPPPPELPLEKSLENLSSVRFTRRHAVVPKAQWQVLKKRAADAGLTSSGLLLAAYAEVLAAWSKSPRFSINLTFFNRMPVHPEINHVVGDFTSVMFLAVDPVQGTSFRRRALDLQKQLWKDMEYPYFSGIELLREGARTDGKHGPSIMPVVFTSNLFEAGDKMEDLAYDMKGRVVYGISQTPQVWLDLQVSEYEDALVIFWDAVEALFPQRVLEEMFQAYLRLLDHLALGNPDWEDRLLPFTPTRQLTRHSDPAAEVPDLSVPLQVLFQRQADVRQGLTAIVNGCHRITYGELSLWSNGIGARLRRGGALPNRLVAVVMEKGWEQVVAVLGVLKSGAAYLPIDPAVPKERLHYLLADGEVEQALTQPHLATTLPWPEKVRVITVDREDIDTDTSMPETVQSPRDLAYVIHTSGSTGQPKGVMIDHRGAVNTILDVNHRFSVGPEDRVLALSSLNFDLSVYDVFGTLAAGGTLVIPDAVGTRDPNHWINLMAQENITIWNSVPMFMQMLITYVEGRRETPPSGLRVVMLSGDWIPLDLPDRLKKQLPETRLFSLGGATEASIWSILYPVTAVAPDWKSIPYGKAMDNQQFHVLDRELAPRPDWVPGDLYIGGMGLARGYWRDDRKTRQNFIRHPDTDELLYRTGDLGRMLPDGNIEILGREDFQVKIRGYRVELGEIEATINRHPAVREAVVTAFGEPGGDMRLVGHVVTKKNRDAILFNHETADPVFSKMLWDALCSAGEIGTRKIPKNLDPDTYPLFLKLADQQALRAICRALAGLSVLEDQATAPYPGAPVNPGTTFAPEAFMERCGIVPRYARLISHWLSILHEADAIRLVRKGHFRLEPDRIRTILEEGYPAQTSGCLEKFIEKAGNPKFMEHWGDLAEKINHHLKDATGLHTDLLTGKTDPLALLLNPGAGLSAEAMEEFNPARAHTAVMVQHLFAALVVHPPAEGQMRILEVGTRMASVAAQVLPLLSEENTRYTFTDASSFFLDRSRKRFDRWPFAQFHLLDTERPPEEQGFSAHRYHVIFADNTLHRACNVGNTLAHLSRLLAPGGILLLTENTCNQDLMAVTVGLLEDGFSYLEDDRKNGFSPLLPADSWQETLLSSGFEKTAFFPGKGDADTAFGQHVIIAMSPTTIRRFDPKMLDEALKSFLPDYMMPSAWMRLDALPLTSNGKVDRKSLSEPGQEASRPPAPANHQPETRLESAVTSAMAAILKRPEEEIGRNQSFFALGGDSLQALRLINRLREDFGVELSMRRLFETPDVTSVSRFIIENRAVRQAETELIEGKI